MNKQYIKWVMLISSAILLFLLAACNGQSTTNVQDIEADKKMTVVASFYPLAELSRQVGGEHVDVITMTPPGAEPHDYEPTPHDIVQLEAADIFIFNGAGQDPWAEKVAQTLKDKNIAVINMSEHFTLIEGDIEHHDEEGVHDEHAEEVLPEADEPHEDHQEDEHVSEHPHEYDPHFWLDPTLAIKETQYIRDILIKKDPEHAEDYRNNAELYTTQLSSLHFDFQKDLSSCKLKTFITSHRAFGYLAHQYGLEQLSIAGLSPEEEPSPQQLANLAELIKEKNIKVIFFETLVSPDLAKTLAEETGAETLVLNPIEGLTEEEVNEGENYLTLMRKNINNLKKALECF